MVDYYLVGEANYLDVSDHVVYVYLDPSGYPEGEYGSRPIETYGAQNDPFWSLGLDTETMASGQLQLELGLLDSYRIKYTASGIYGWHEDSGSGWIDMFAGGGGDNLGDHIATQDLEMGSNVINSADANLLFTFGRQQLGRTNVTSAVFGYRGFAITDYAIKQNSSFATQINSVTTLNFRLSNVTKMSLATNLTMSVPIAMAGNDILSSGALAIKVSGITTDYFRFDTVSNQPAITIIGATQGLLEGDAGSNWVVNTNTHANDFIISRGAGVTEYLAIGVDDKILYFNYTQDESDASIHAIEWDILTGASGAHRYEWNIKSVQLMRLTESELNLNVPIAMGANAITSDDEDLIFTFGRTQVGRSADYLYIGYRGMSHLNFAIRQDPTFETYLNSADGKELLFGINRVEKMALTATALTMSVPIALGTNYITSDNVVNASTFGRCTVGLGGSGYAYFGYVGMGSTSFMIRQNSSFATTINAPTGQDIIFMNNGATVGFIDENKMDLSVPLDMSNNDIVLGSGDITTTGSLNIQSTGNDNVVILEVPTGGTPDDSILRIKGTDDSVLQLYNTTNLRSEVRWDNGQTRLEIITVGGDFDMLFGTNSITRMILDENALTMSVPIAMGSNAITSSGVLKLSPNGQVGVDWFEFSIDGGGTTLTTKGYKGLLLKSDDPNYVIINISEDANKQFEMGYEKTSDYGYFWSMQPIRIVPDNEWDNYAEFTASTNVISLNMGGGGNDGKIINVVDPTDDQDVATKNYVDIQVIAANSLDGAFDVGKIIDGANSVVNALTIGNGTDTLRIYGGSAGGVGIHFISSGEIILAGNDEYGSNRLHFWSSSANHPRLWSDSGQVWFYDGSSWEDVYGDFKDQASAISSNTFDKIKAVRTLPDGKIDYDTMPSEIEIVEEEDIYMTDVGDMMYYNFSAIKEMIEKIEQLEARIKELEDK